MVEDGSVGGRPRRRYRTRNWREYDRALVARGDLTVWISPDLAWPRPRPSGPEIQIRCAILNTFNRLGMLHTVAVA